MGVSSLLRAVEVDLPKLIGPQERTDQFATDYPRAWKLSGAAVFGWSPVILDAVAFGCWQPFPGHGQLPFGYVPTRRDRSCVGLLEPGLIAGRRSIPRLPLTWRLRPGVRVCMLDEQDRVLGVVAFASSCRRRA